MSSRKLGNPAKIGFVWDQVDCRMFPKAATQVLFYALKTMNVYLSETKKKLLQGQHFFCALSSTKIRFFVFNSFIHIFRSTFFTDKINLSVHICMSFSIVYRFYFVLTIHHGSM